MLVLAGGGSFVHARVADLPRFLRPKDLLVVNDTKVIRGRLRARKETGGRVEILLLNPFDGTEGAREWEALARPSARLGEGMLLPVGGGFAVRLAKRLDGGRWRVVLEAQDPWEAVARWGEVPLPPYIRRTPGDPRRALDARRYQTVFAAQPGSVAAPTAGLHFDGALLRALARRGIAVARVTLAVGYGTFAPIRAERLEDHRLHAEAYRLPPEAAEAVAAARARGGRVVAVGTTTVRVLESCAAGEGLVVPSCGRTELFIRPGYRFRVVDLLLTNFHLPRSSLLALVMAFGGVDRVRAAYREAVAARYRFASYGDAMLVARERGAGG